jgi:hypothetical protein
MNLNQYAPQGEPKRWYRISNDPDNLSRAQQFKEEEIIFVSQDQRSYKVHTPEQSNFTRVRNKLLTEKHNFRQQDFGQTQKVQKRYKNLPPK